jgi:ubiquinone/menaquinone biosynthesis C-methylase UbiE
MNKHVNYDEIATTYNQRFTVDKRQSTALAILALAQEIRAKRILEVGCGTGRWLTDLLSQTPHVFGLDYSTGMLIQAHLRDPQLTLVRARAEELPFQRQSFDLVFCVNALHHFEQQPEFIQRAHQILRPSGALALIGMNPSDQRTKWYIYDYFEGTLETDRTRFPTWGMVLEWMITSGFERVEWHRLEQIANSKIGRAVLDDPFLVKNSTSQLILLKDDAYRAGLKRILKALERAEEANEKIVFDNVIEMQLLIGWS